MYYGLQRFKCNFSGHEFPYILWNNSALEKAHTEEPGIEPGTY